MKKFLLLKKVKNTVPWMYVMILMVKKLLGRFMKNTSNQKTNQTIFRVEKVINRKGDNWKGYDNSFNSLIGKKRRSINE